MIRSLRIILSVVLLIVASSCNAQTKKNETTSSANDKIEVYYFHFSSRCMTCRTVEQQAKSNLEILYPEMVNTGTINFQSVNLDEETGKKLGDKLEVSGQTLLIVKGGKQINITNEGFMYAVHQPEKFKAVIKDKVDSLL